MPPPDNIYPENDKEMNKMLNPKVPIMLAATMTLAFLNRDCMRPSRAVEGLDGSKSDYRRRRKKNRVRNKMARESRRRNR